jgi:hypothetical protein|uniref:Uncharacterized protein n=1 Tax=Siphoviridae sp. ctYcY12 TaxID=2825550 RepID=A0A8S5TTZ6_9CAUD|nr:MAG TPA: hypothetical protein [Siphoviridae sp. ctYcY12]
MKKTFWEKCKDEVVNSFVKYLVWTIPLSIIIFLLGLFKSNILFPDLEADVKEISIIADKQILSPDNPATPGRIVKFDEELNVEMPKMYAPEIKISFSGKGQINSAYIIYKMDEDWIIQKADEVKPFVIGTIITPKELNITINFGLHDEELQKRAYLVLIDKKDGSKHIWCTYINPNTNDVDLKSESEINGLMLYEDRDIFSIDKSEIQKEIADIYNLKF